MRISLLLNKEPFRLILQNTLKSYLLNFDTNCEVFFISRFSYKVIKYRKFIYSENSHLNFYANIRIHRRYFEVLVNEYSRSKRKYFIYFQKIYVFAALSTMGRFFLSNNFLIVKSSSDVFRNTVILGGFHRIRLLRPNEGTSEVILKSGFNEFWILNEIRLRTDFNITVAPKFIQCSKNPLLFKEEYVPGIPINRLSNEECTKHALEASRLLNIQLIKSSAEPEKITDWLSLRKNEMVSVINRVEPRYHKIKQHIESLFSEVACYIENNHLEKISIAHSHGDFQYSNILLKKNGELVVIDWEATRRRWFAYDFLVLFTSCRNKAFIENEYFLRVIKSNNFLKELFKNHKITHELAYLLFCIEELYYQLSIDCEPLLYRPLHNFEIYLKSLSSEIEKKYAQYE